jgi:hypothetical protein
MPAQQLPGHKDAHTHIYKELPKLDRFLLWLAFIIKPAHLPARQHKVFQALHHHRCVLRLTAGLPFTTQGPTGLHVA